MYNRLKTLVNQVRNLGSTKWDDHEMVKVILTSLVFLNPTQVQLIRGDPRYKLMSPKEVIGKFVSFELMIKGSKKIIEQGGGVALGEAPLNIGNLNRVPGFFRVKNCRIENSVHNVTSPL